MNKKLEDCLLREISKHRNRYHNYHNVLFHESERNNKRLVNPEKKYIKKPIYWSQDRLFNPFYVNKNKAAILKSLETQLTNGDYVPHDPYIHEVPKDNSKTREVSIFQIPDAAVSNMIYNSLISKNKHRFSSLSYAYRNDRNVHFAIQDIGVEFNNYSRLFVSEFDFSDFFGSIDHDYLNSLLEKTGFLISDFEKKIISSFLRKGNKGIPQGTSISLFLANLACWELDRAFENEGLRFARYADDTVVWSQDYSKICKSFNIIENFSRVSKIDINIDKSSGISLLTKKNLSSELSSTKHFVDFLGYSVSLENISIKKKAVKRIKKEISYILYRNLLQPFQVNHLQGQIIPSNGNDSALVTSVLKIRRYLYGGINETLLKRYLKGDLKQIKFKGLMSFYPLLNDDKQLKELDSWLISTILNVLKKRKKLLISRNLIKNTYNQFPFNVNSKNIIQEFKGHKYKGAKSGLIEIPSLLRIHKAINKGLVEKGISYVMANESSEYDYN